MVPATKTRVDEAVAMLRRKATRHTLEGMARYGLPSDHAMGVAVSDIQKVGKELGRDHDLALALWDTGWYEARMLVAFVGEPERLTMAQMDRWCRDFDNWGIVDTLCFNLFDRSPHAWSRVVKWRDRKDEFQKRAAFALLACLALHDKAAPDKGFLEGLRFIEEAAADERNFVKKGSSWALRLIGRRNPRLYAASLVLARRLAASSDAAERWLGRDALRDLTRPDLVKRLARA
jgi:3-methyladenine DNA glycosylase AlkD